MKNNWIEGIFNNKVYCSNEKPEKMTAQHTNPVFVSDESYTERTTSPTKQANITQRDVFTIDLKDGNKAKEAYEHYDPYMHRKVEHPTTNSETLFHLLKGCLGTGILAMPKAFNHSGYALGSIGTVIIGLICTYCIHLLVTSQYELCKRRRIASLTYPATAEAAFAEGPKALRGFAPYSVHIVNAFLLVYQIGTCCVYIVFIATNVESVVDLHLQNMGMEKLGIKIYMLIFLLPLILINWIKNLKRLAPFSTAANAITLVSFGIILYYILTDQPSFHNKHPVGELENIPLFFGTVLFALEAIGVIMPLENEMKTPRSFIKPVGVLNSGMSLIIFLYLGMGLLGYLTYGDAVEATITLNLPENDVMAQVVKLSLALAIFVTYGLQCYVAVDITWNEYLGPKLEKNSRQTLWEYVTRTCIVLVTFLLAIAVPALDLFISLFGALCLSALGIAIPAAIETCTYWYSFTGMQFYLMVIRNVALIIFGIFGLIAGTYTSLRDIIREFS